jgi:hypothetical protein
MSSTGRDNHPRSAFVDSRVSARHERADQRNRAMRTVAGQARDREDFTDLLSMLGLDDGSPVLFHALAAYARQVAVAVGVPVEAVGFEVSDTATAYVGLVERLSARPSRDLMLVWDERLGWSVAVETMPGEPPLVAARLGNDTVPTPAAVAVFVAAVVAGRHTERARLVQPSTNRDTLAQRMVAACVETHGTPAPDGREFTPDGLVASEPARGVVRQGPPGR